MAVAYVYQSDIYCEDCALDIMLDVGRTRTQAEITALREEGSDAWPQGPYDDGGGEADAPQNCRSCGCFLRNPLTQDGYHYVIVMIEDHVLRGRGKSEVLAEWFDYYKDDCVRSGRTLAEECPRL
jgi:hypothetical protein